MGDFVVVTKARLHRDGNWLHSIEDGYTLLELLVVLAIIALLVGFVAPKMIGYLGRAKSDAAKVQLQNVATALDLYRLDVGQYPSESEGLGALLTAPNGAVSWHGPYLPKADGILDPWKEQYVYKMPGQRGEFDLQSLGADRQVGGDGENQDITSW